MMGGSMNFKFHVLFILAFSAIFLASCQKSQNHTDAPPDYKLDNISGASNALPTIQFKFPETEISIPDASHLNISWFARYLDDDAKISIRVLAGPLVPCGNGILIASNLSENTINNYTLDTSQFVMTQFVVCLIIDDSFSPAVSVKSPIISKILPVTSPKLVSPSAALSLPYYNGVRLKWQDFDAFSHSISIKTSATNSGTCSAGQTLVSGITDADKNNYWDFLPSVHGMSAGTTYLCLVYQDNLGKFIYSFSPLITIQAANLNIAMKTDFDNPSIPVGAVLHSGAVGNSTYWSSGGNAGPLSLAHIMPVDSFTLEFGMKVPVASTNFQGMDNLALSKDKYILFNGPNFTLSLSPSMGWQGTFKIAGGQTDFSIWLDGVNENSYSYLADNNWHHVAIVWDGRIGDVKLYIDGKMPLVFNQKVPPGSLQVVSGPLYLGNNFDGEIDQIALTDRVLPQSLLLNHSQKLNSGFAYDNTLATVPAFINPIHAVLPALYTAPSIVGSNPLVTLLDMPVPVIKSTSTLAENRLTFKGRYLSQTGSLETDITINQREADIQAELAKNYHFALQLSEGQYTSINASNDQVLVLANANPNFSLGIWSGYQEMPDKFINNFSLLPVSMSLTNLADEVIGCNGLPNGKCPAPFSSLGLFAEDAFRKADLLEPYLTALTRDVDFIQDGRDFLDWEITGYKINSRAIQLRANMGLQWDTFQSRNLARLYTNYAFEIQNYDFPQPRSINSAPYMMMDVAGKNSFNRSYEEMKGINGSIGGTTYPTPLFIPLNPSAWKKSQTGSLGLSWIWNSRRNEGTKLFAPMVSAHQESATQASLPPFNYLANLKFMGVWGSEFYNSGINFPMDNSTDSRDLIWPLASVGLVQGALSHADDLIKNGFLLVYETFQKDFSISLSPFDTPIAVRKHLTLEKYLIATGRMPSSIKNGSIPANTNVTLTISGKTITLESRPQGSLYYFDNSAALPVLLQLDKFHEIGHPQRWSKTTLLEAELYDDLGMNSGSRETSPNIGASLNYSAHQTYLTGVSSNSPIKYNFTPNKAGNLKIEANLSTSVATNFTIEVFDPSISLIVPIYLNSQLVSTFGIFQTVNLGTIAGLVRKNYILKVRVDALGSHWDAFTLSPL